MRAGHSKRSAGQLVLLAGLVLLLSAGSVWAQSVVINGVPLVTSRMPVNMKGSLMLPMRDVFEALNSEIKWFAAERKIMATRGATVVELWLDVPFATINGQQVSLPVAPTLLNASTYVPLRFPAEAFGGTVKWDGATRTALIDIPPAEGGTSLPATGSTTTGSATGAESTAGSVAEAADKVVEGVVVETYVAQKRLLLQEANENWRFVNITSSTVITRGPDGGVSKPATLAEVQTGDVAVAVSGADDNVARQVTLTYYEFAGEVAALAAGNLVFADGTVMRLRDNVEVLDANGEATDFSALPAGTRVVVRYDSSNRSVWEIRLPQAAAVKPADTPDGPPEIYVLGLVEPQTVFKAGDKITVQLRGTPKGEAMVNVGRVARDLALPEVRPGVYQAEVTLPTGPDVRSMAISGVLTKGNQRTRPFTSTTRLTIDSTPPRVTSLSPQAQAKVETANPVLEVVYDDGNGSGVDPATVKLWVNGQEVTNKAKVHADRLTYTAQGLKNGRVTAQVKLVDGAGNETNERWVFTVEVAQGAGILEAVHNVTGTLVAGNEIIVSVAVKDPGGSGSWALGRLKRGLTLQREGASNIYQGTYTIQPGDKTEGAAIAVTYKDPAGQVHRQTITNPVTVNSDLPNALAITAPADGAKAPAMIVVSGEAPPNSRVRVTMTYTTKALVRISGEIWKGQVTSSAAGQWQTPEVPAEVGLFGRADNYTVTAELLDAEGQVQSKSTISLVK